MHSVFHVKLLKSYQKNNIFERVNLSLSFVNRVTNEEDEE